MYPPFLYVVISDADRGDFPGTGDAAPGEALKVELTADLGVGPTRVGHVVTVEGHHVAQHICRSRLI